jgi:hypothetical protein
LAPFPQLKPIMGRPTEYKPEYCAKVIECMGQGFSLSAFAGTIPVSRQQIYVWISAYRDFADAVSRARSARILWLENKLLHARKGAETSAAIFALRNADPVEWRDMRTVEHRVTVDIATLSDAQLNAIASGATPGELGIVIDGEAHRIAEKPVDKGAP